MKKPYARRTYPSRGMMEYRNPIDEFLTGNKCVICGKTLARKVSEKERIEDYHKWRNRKTCGYVRNKDGKLKKGKCLRKFLRGENNPKWRGGFPICKDCGKRTAWYKSKNPRNPQNYCKKCFNKRMAIMNKERGKKLKGIYPEKLKKFAFKKGRRPENKLYEDYTQCEISGCIEKPIARFLCHKHYQQWQKKKITNPLTPISSMKKEITN